MFSSCMKWLDKKNKKKSSCSLCAYCTPDSLPSTSCVCFHFLLLLPCRWAALILQAGTVRCEEVLTDLLRITELAHGGARTQTSVLQNASLVLFLTRLPLNCHNRPPRAPSSECAFSLTLPRAHETTPHPCYSF